MARWRVLAACALAVASGVAASSVVTASAALALPDEEREERRREVRVVRAHGGGYLGVTLDEVGAEDVKRLGLPAEGGALVKEVSADSPASKAGLRADDVVVSFQGEAVRSAAQLARMVRETPSGRQVSLGILRGGGREEVEVKLGERRLGRMMPHLEKLEELGDLRNFELHVPPVPPVPPMPPMPPDAEGLARGEAFRSLFGRTRLGIRYTEMPEQLARYFKVEGGVLVSEVSEGSPAAKAGLRAGDVIVKVDGRAVRRGADLHREVARADTDQDVVIGIQRDGRPLEVRVKLERRERRRPGAPTT